jgi:hypothetical protein
MQHPPGQPWARGLWPWRKPKHAHKAGSSTDKSKKPHNRIPIDVDVPRILYNNRTNCRGPAGGSSTFGGCRCLHSRGGAESNTWRSLTKKASDVHGLACTVLLCHYAERAVLGSGYQARHGGLTCITPSHDMVVVGSLARACPSRSSSDGITSIVIGVELAMGAVSRACPGRSSSTIGIPSGGADTQLAVRLAGDRGPHLRRQQRVVEYARVSVHFSSSVCPLFNYVN